MKSIASSVDHERRNEKRQLLYQNQLSFFLQVIQGYSLIIKTNKQRKADILMKLMKNLLIIASSLWTT